MVKLHARTVHSCEIGLLGNCHLSIKALGAIRTTLTGPPGPRRVHKRLWAFVVQKRRRLWCDNCCSRVIGPISGHQQRESSVSVTFVFRSAEDVLSSAPQLHSLTHRLQSVSIEIYVSGTKWTQHRSNDTRDFDSDWSVHANLCLFCAVQLLILADCSHVLPSIVRAFWLVSRQVFPRSSCWLHVPGF